MTLRSLLVLLGLALFVTACTETQRYPVTGEECGPEDPVKDLSAQQCVPAA